jgi:chaperone modulatory protein CbpM
MTARAPLRNGRPEGKLLNQWIEAGWLTPHQELSGKRFSDVDLARAYFIRDLQDLGVNDDGIPIILDLIDQLHGLRHLVHELLLALKAQRQEQERK